jgi:hypothetical protein
MTQTSYTYYRTIQGRYIFVSAGKKHIQKVVQFESTVNENIMNMAFGDLLEDGSLDDTIKSNNGDMVRVLATVIEILKDYTRRHPNKEILFTGSTPQRTKLYTRILKTYYQEFNKDFHISSITLSNNTMKRTVFDPTQNVEYLAFLIRRI